MFDGSGFRAPHDGRQKMPVVRTPVTKMPSELASLWRKARSISARGGSVGVKRAGCAFMRRRLRRDRKPPPPENGHQIPLTFSDAHTPHWRYGAISRQTYGTSPSPLPESVFSDGTASIRLSVAVSWPDRSWSFVQTVYGGFNASRGVMS